MKAVPPPSTTSEVGADWQGPTVNPDAHPSRGAKAFRSSTLHRVCATVPGRALCLWSRVA
jgi:hypothetical protein